MKRDEKKFIQGYICAVACLLNGHGSFIEAKDMLSNIGDTSIKSLTKCGVDVQDIETLKKHDLIS